MKIIFFASGKIAVPCLKALIQDKFDILLVATAPDKKKGRHLEISSTPVKDVAVTNKLKIFQPQSLKSRESVEFLKSFNADVFIVFSYGQIFTKEVIDIPKIISVNIHTSLLPKYRGAAPINWALINGETKTGITIIKMNEEIDEGDIVFRKEFEINSSDNALTLEDRLANLAVPSIKEVLLKISKNDISFGKQNNRDATYAPKLRKQDGRIDWDKEAFEIRNKIRGCIPWPGSYAFLNEATIKIWDAQIIDKEQKRGLPPGTIASLDKDGILIATKNKPLLIKELQLASGKRLAAWQFVQGYRLKIGQKFT